MDVVESGETMSLQAIVNHYVTHYRSKAEEELDWFRGQATLEDAIRAAALAHNAHGRRYSHQWRLRHEVLASARDRLLFNAAALAQQPTFARLYACIEQLLRPVGGVGELYFYDTALRIGARLGLMPEAIYLHAGTRQGAAALGYQGLGRFLLKSDLPAELRVLAAHEIEDLLCIYKAQLRRAIEGQPIDLPQQSRCFLGDEVARLE